MSFPNSNFEGNISTCVWQSHFEIFENGKVSVGRGDIYYAKKY